MSRKYKKLLIYSLVLVIPFALLFVKQATFTGFKFTVVNASLGPVEIISLPLLEIKKLFLYRHSYERYHALEREVDSLKARLIGQEEVIRENARFKQLLGLKTDQPFSSVAATVIGRDPSNWNATVIIDKGENSGLKQGMPVVNALGVIGKIAEVSKKTSKVILLNDPNFSVAGIIDRSREGGLISGTLQGMCRMRYLSPSANIDVGDKVITSQLSSSFPQGLLIGEVVAIEESQSSPTIECLVEPAVFLSQIEEVLVIVK